MFGKILFNIHFYAFDSTKTSRIKGSGTNFTVEVSVVPLPFV